MQVYLETLGCRLNFSEMETLARELHASGHHVVASPAEADVCILNTCAVTHVAGRKSRQATRSLSTANPKARLLITGCYAELEREQAADLPGVRWVVGNQDKERIVRILDHASDEAETTPVPALSPTAPDAVPFALSRTRAFVKVQDGCNNHCTFCIVTIARGRERSIPVGQIVQQVQTMAYAGTKEAVLTGVHLGGYGRDQGTDLRALVRTILEQTDIPRLRLSSLEPFDLESDFFDLWTDPRLCPHLHLPLQNGCDATLKRMARRCTAAQYSHLVEAARSRIPDLILTTDIIVGFPGETDDEFTQSLAFTESIGFAHLHVFPYSLREGTAAAQMPGQVSSKAKRERSAAMREVDRRCGRTIRRQVLGQVRPVLWEGEGRPMAGEMDAVWSGLTDNYLRVLTVASAEMSLQNTITPTRLARLEGDALWAEVTA